MKMHLGRSGKQKELLTIVVGILLLSLVSWENVEEKEMENGKFHYTELREDERYMYPLQMI